MAPRILTFDIETSPNIAAVWGIWQQNIGLNQLFETGRVICWGAKWLDEDETMFQSEYDSSYEDMLASIYWLIDEADIAVHYNGKKFDMPWLRGEWALQGWTPPSPVQEIDLLNVVKKQFRFPSNKLAHVVKRFDLQRKIENEGQDLWTKCTMIAVTPEEKAVQAEAWRQMEEYCRNDVVIEEDLYQRILPWINSHPSVGLYTELGDEQLVGCQTCGSTNLQLRGFAFTSLGKYQRFVCNDCGKWGKGKKSLAFVETRSAA